MPVSNDEPVAVSHVRFNWTVISIVASLLVQSAVLVGWAAKLDQRVEVLEQKVQAAAGVSETVARVDERTLGLVAAMNRVEERLSAEGARPAR